MSLRSGLRLDEGFRNLEHKVSGLRCFQKALTAQYGVLSNINECENWSSYYFQSLHEARDLNIQACGCIAEGGCDSGIDLN